jgi:hypothetical protein
MPITLTLVPGSGNIWVMNEGDSMSFESFTNPQRMALLDLLVLGMYADGHLALAEDNRLNEILTAMGWETAHDRNQQFDAAVTRIRQSSQTADAVAAHATRLAQNFTTQSHRGMVYDLLKDLLSSDQQVVPPESRFLSVVKGVLKI